MTLKSAVYICTLYIARLLCVITEVYILMSTLQHANRNAVSLYFIEKDAIHAVMCIMHDFSAGLSPSC